MDDLRNKLQHNLLKELLDLILENQLRIMYDLANRNAKTEAAMDALLNDQIHKTTIKHNDINIRW